MQRKQKKRKCKFSNNFLHKGFKLMPRLKLDYAGVNVFNFQMYIAPIPCVHFLYII